MNAKTIKLIAGGAFSLLFALWILILKTVDVGIAGPVGYPLGLHRFNTDVHIAIGTNKYWDYFTQALGIVAILVVVMFAIIGVLQLIKRKDLRKVDQCIIVAGCLYAAMFAFYVFFEKVIINYRPVLKPGETFPEASFPSSHTMLACVVFGSLITLLPQYIDDKHSGKIIKVVCILLIAISVIGRILCGYHWITDIIGGVLLSAALLSFFYAFMKPRKRSNGKG